MPDYLHSALRGNQLHESKIKTLLAGSPMPLPEWEGQVIAIGKKLYYSITKNGVLAWEQPVSYNVPVLPPNVVTFESGLENPPASRTRGGIFYMNSSTKKMWYLPLAANQWIELGANSSVTFDIFSGRSAESGQGNYFGLLNPSDPFQDNCLLIKKWQPVTKYYLAVKCPSLIGFGGSDDNLFYLELWKNNEKVILASYPELTENLFALNTSLFTDLSRSYRLGVYLNIDLAKIYLNFKFNLDTRLIEITDVANVFYG